MNKGIHHIGLATHDMEATLAFYEKTLGFETRVAEMIDPETGGCIRHAFIDMGRGQLLAFMEPNDIPQLPAFDTSINKGLGIRGGMYHFAFWCDDAAELESKRQGLMNLGVVVTDVVDHGWCQSIYFHDPNHLMLEYCCYAEELGDSHVADRRSDKWRGFARS